MDIQAILEFLFPPQCGACDAVGSGFCTSCAGRSVRCARRLPTLDVEALGPYDGALRASILALKSGRRDVARALALYLEAIVPPNAIVVPVPTTAARRRQRGFDGCVLIANCVAACGDAAVLDGLEQVAGDAQRGRKREARIAAHGRFRWRAQAMSGETVVLLDDVSTTGATLEDCAAAIRGAGGCVDRAVVVALA